MQPVVPRRGYCDGRFGQIHFRIARPPAESGRPPLICFHMSPMSGRIFERFLAEIGADRVAVAPDTPGYGASDAPLAPPEILDYAQAMGDLIDALGFTGPVDLMGYHTGSKIAVELALLRPRQIRRVILISAPILTESERQAMRAHYGRRTPSADGSHLADQWRRFLHYHLYGAQTIEDAADAFPDILLGRSNEWWGHRAAFNHYLDRRLPLIPQPVLVFNTDDDLWTVTRRAAPFLHHGRIVELPGWGHGFLDHATVPAAALARSFLDAPDEAPFAALALPTPPSGALSPGHFAAIPGEESPA